MDADVKSLFIIAGRKVLRREQTTEAECAWRTAKKDSLKGAELRPNEEKVGSLAAAEVPCSQQSGVGGAGLSVRPEDDE